MLTYAEKESLEYITVSADTAYRGLSNKVWLRQSHTWVMHLQ